MHGRLRMPAGHDLSTAVLNSGARIAQFFYSGAHLNWHLRGSPQARCLLTAGRGDETVDAAMNSIIVCLTNNSLVAMTGSQYYGSLPKVLPGRPVNEWCFGAVVTVETRVQMVL